MFEKSHNAQFNGGTYYEVKGDSYTYNGDSPAQPPRQPRQGALRGNTSVSNSFNNSPTYNGSYHNHSMNNTGPSTHVRQAQNVHSGNYNDNHGAREDRRLPSQGYHDELNGAVPRGSARPRGLTGPPSSHGYDLHPVGRDTGRPPPHHLQTWLEEQSVLFDDPVEESDESVDSQSRSRPRQRQPRPHHPDVRSDGYPPTGREYPQHSAPPTLSGQTDRGDWGAQSVTSEYTGSNQSYRTSQQRPPPAQSFANYSVQSSDSGYTPSQQSTPRAAGGFDMRALPDNTIDRISQRFASVQLTDPSAPRKPGHGKSRGDKYDTVSVSDNYGSEGESDEERTRRAELLGQRAFSGWL